MHEVQVHVTCVSPLVIILSSPFSSNHARLPLSFIYDGISILGGVECSTQYT